MAASGGLSQGIQGDAWATAWKVQCDAAALGFDWPHIEGVLEKLFEEVDEIRQALAEGDPMHARSELGDVLFSVINLARFLDADGPAELKRSTERFQARFQRLNEAVLQSGRSIEQCSLEELDAVWEQVKAEMMAQSIGLDKGGGLHADCCPQIRE